MNNQEDLTADMIIQFSIVGLILLAACFWIFWKIFHKNRNKSSNSCCGCAIADSCKKYKKS